MTSQNPRIRSPPERIAPKHTPGNRRPETPACIRSHGMDSGTDAAAAAATNTLGGHGMVNTRRSLATSGFAFLVALAAQQAAAQAPAIDRDDIGGVVQGPGGPEAGVWVIAETKDLGTR